MKMFCPNKKCNYTCEFNYSHGFMCPKCKGILNKVNPHSCVQSDIRESIKLHGTEITLAEIEKITYPKMRVRHREIFFQICKDLNLE